MIAVPRGGGARCPSVLLLPWDSIYRVPTAETKEAMNRVQAQQTGDGLEMVRAEQIVKSIGSNTVLNGVDLSVKRGQVVVIIGPSGSGKTTLLRCLNHLEKIDSGRIYIEGELVGYREVNERLIEDREAN